MSIEQAITLLEKNQVKEGLQILLDLQQEPQPPPMAFLISAIALEVTQFSFLAVEAAKKELILFNDQKAKNFIAKLNLRSEERHKRSPKNYPKLSFIGTTTQDDLASWQRCIDSLQFQSYLNIELCLVSKEKLALPLHFPPFVKAIHCPRYVTVLDGYECAINESSGEYIGILEEPDTVFSNLGAELIASAFFLRPDFEILQTERYFYSLGNYPVAMRTSLPIWSQASLLDESALEAPTLAFSWSDVLFKKKLIKSFLPLCREFIHASALELASRAIKSVPIYTIPENLYISVKEIEGKSPVLSTSFLAEAKEIINREKRCITSFSSSAPSIIKIERPAIAGDALPFVSPELFIRGDSRNTSISLVTACFNAEDYIEPCIDSILSQNYPNLEFMILDGGSTDNTLSIIKKYERYLSFFRSHPDSGHYPAVQEGFERSTGTIMSWLNSDDLLAPYSLQLAAHLFAEHHDVDWITGKVATISESNVLNITKFPDEYSGDKYFNDGFDDPFIQQEGTFWRRSLWDRAGSTLDLQLRLAADMELWTRFFQLAELYTASVPLGIFRRRGGQRSEIYRNGYMKEAASVINKIRGKATSFSGPIKKSGKILDVPILDLTLPRHIA